MCKVYLSSVLVLLLASVSFGSTWTNASGIDSLWSTAGNWDAIPGSGDGVYIGSSSAAGPTIDSTVTAVGGWTAIGMGYSRTVTMTGGSLTVSGLTIGERGYCTGTLDISGGTANVNGWLTLGGATSGSANTGIITMSGNSSLTAQSLMIGNESSDSVGIVNLGGSSVLTVTSSLWFRDDKAGARLVNFDIASAAKFIVPESQLNSLNYYIGEGWITGNGIVGNVLVTDLGDNLQVTVLPEPATLSLLAIGLIGVLKRKR